VECSGQNYYGLLEELTNYLVPGMKFFAPATMEAFRYDHYDRDMGGG